MPKHLTKQVGLLAS